ncbi:MAG: filamentous hemagglutinin N-terminal domain-containing protein, partial [Bacillota bacterium]|nr:filamentous hemagglutinin N-terminal domain-containing protein [Bacillota bacterium]
MASPAWPLPTGPQVAVGAASFNQIGNNLTIANTPGAIIDWNAFFIGAAESVRFQQQHSLSSVLNRVTGGDASRILGELSSNGRVWLINPNGILFGPRSRVDVNGLIASTLNVSNADFLAGRMNFVAGNQAGKLDNAGTLNAANNIYLIAPDIENSGIIRSAQGEVLLAAGREVSLVDAAHPDIQVVVSAPDDKAVNLGELVAGKISVFGALVQHKGKANADRVEVDDHGRIVFRASGDTLIEGGTATATHANGQGGRIEVLGNSVAVTGEALIDASGTTGGGTILVGGDFQGKNPDIPNSTITYFGPD